MNRLAHIYTFQRKGEVTNILTYGINPPHSTYEKFSLWPRRSIVVSSLHFPVITHWCHFFSFSSSHIGPHSVSLCTIYSAFQRLWAHSVCHVFLCTLFLTLIYPHFIPWSLRHLHWSYVNPPNLARFSSSLMVLPVFFASTYFYAY